MQNFFEHQVENQGPRPKRHVGFTLIELLVVICIIALLAAILFPVFGRVRENARRTSCASNMKQVGLGIMQYVQDSDERFPRFAGSTVYVPPANGPTVPGEKYMVSKFGGDPQYLDTWMDFIFPYVKSLQVYDCPSINYPAKVDTTAAGYGVSVFTDPTVCGPLCGTESYPALAYSRCISHSQAGPNDASCGAKDDKPIHMATIQGISGKIMMVHNGWALAYINRSDMYIRYSSNAGGPTYLARTYPHLDGMNIMYADGHVKYLARMSTPTITCNNTSPCGYWDPGVTPPSG